MFKVLTVKRPWMTTTQQTDLDLAQWLIRLEALHPADIELGLDRVNKVLSNLALGAIAKRIVTVAGTNGKGSTIAALNALLVSQDCKTAVYTSPHLRTFNERICVDGEVISDAVLCGALARVDVARGEIALTFFEFTTLAAMLIFSEADIDVALLEVGLGGRLDAVNCIDPDLAIITSIALDHQAWLGEQRDDIAREKAGILRAAIPAVVSERDPPASLTSAINKLSVSARFIGNDFDIERTPDGLLFSHADVSWAMPTNGLPLDSLGAAVMAFDLLGYALNEMSLASMQGLVLEGRNQRFEVNGVQVLVDVAHNPAAVAHLASLLPTSGRKIAVFAALADKDWQGMLASVSEQFDAWFLAELPSVTRALSASVVANHLGQQGCNMISVSKNAKQALARALQVTGKGDTVIIFGSFYTVGAVLDSLEKRGNHSNG